MNSWLLATALYGMSCAAAAAWLVRSDAFSRDRSPSPSTIDEDPRARAIEVLEHEVSELRSRLLEALAESSEQQRRTAREVMLNRHQTAEIEKRLGPVETGVEFLRSRSEQEQFDDWVESGLLGGSTDVG